ncbi:peptidylprolyl isomerase [Pseudorhodobacter sp.]|uniref:peptidylprolyl isomerase n=1 Tax=Pseudorhodobacter sp. TaxID=1934400 RepID=UPI002647CB5B|nr:peptidylprolyl isomerase [Pseudorhodobacter sp.]MDN5788317.1 SurA N-terminal domain-containing protein [Pseudorhodobacter sp.]
MAKQRFLRQQMAKSTTKSTKNPTDDQPKKKAKGTSAVVWILMGMLVLGLGGFGITNFGGGVTTIGSVGDREIDVNDYQRALQQDINALSAQVGTQLTLQQAQAFGLDAQVRQKLINTAAVDNEAERIGISVDDARVAKEITDQPAFKGPSGAFDRDTYRYTLDRNRLSESQYESKMREDLSRSLLQGAVTGGFIAPDAVTSTLYAYISERRSYSLLPLTSADLQSQPGTPEEAELKSYYETNIAQFTRPEARRITYAALLPDDIADKMPLDEAALKQMYEDRKAEYVQPEHRLVERLVFPTEAAAAAAKTKLDAGTPFETLVSDRGVSLSDIDLGDKAEADLGAAGPAIFALTEPGVVGPLPSDLGPALYRMNGVLAAQNTSFEDARADLTAELATDAARRAIDDQIEGIDDRLASGATLEDLAKETDMKLGQIDFTASSNEGIAGYPAFRKAADAAAVGDFPEVVQLDDGGIFALRLDEIVPPAPIPFDEARDAVAASWHKAAETKALTALAEGIKAKVEAGAALGTFGVVAVSGPVTRSSTVEGNLPSLLTTLFKMQENEVRVLNDGAFVALLQVNSLTPGASDGADAAALKGALSSQVEQALSQDAFQLYTDALTNGAGITINQAAINAVHAQFR